MVCLYAGTDKRLSTDWRGTRWLGRLQTTECTMVSGLLGKCMRWGWRTHDSCCWCSANMACQYEGGGLSWESPFPFHLILEEYLQAEDA